MTFLYVGAAMTIASFIGTKVFPIISGQLMEHYPMTLMYSTTITIISCSILFMLAIFIGGKITQHENKSAIIQKVHSEEMVKFNPSN